MAARGFHQAGDHFDDGAFARAVGTEYPQGLARANGKADIAHRGDRAVALGKGAGFEDGLAHFRVDAGGLKKFP